MLIPVRVVFVVEGSFRPAEVLRETAKRKKTDTAGRDGRMARRHHTGISLPPLVEACVSAPGGGLSQPALRRPGMRAGGGVSAREPA